MRKKILRLLKNIKFLPKKTILSIRHEYYTGKKLNLNKPKEFNEKIQWLKLYYHNPLLSKLACKFEVRSYVKDKIGEQYLNEMYGIYDRFSEIDFNTLPNQFVLKGVHGSSLNLIVKDKSQLNLLEVEKIIGKWLKHDQYKKVGFEWAYKNIKPRIICEKFLEEPGKEVLDDYKFFCFNGEPMFLQVVIGRSINNFKCCYDMEWNKLPFYKVSGEFYEKELKKPKNFDKMVTLARDLAQDLPFSRIDFYSVMGKIVFGEVTFYPSDGKSDFVPNKYNTIIGDYIKLPNKWVK